MGKVVKSLGSIVGLGGDDGVAKAQREANKIQKQQQAQQAEADRQRQILQQNQAADLSASQQQPELVAGGTASEADEVRKRRVASGLATQLGVNLG